MPRRAACETIAAHCQGADHAGMVLLMPFVKRDPRLFLGTFTPRLVLSNTVWRVKTWWPRHDRHPRRSIIPARKPMAAATATAVNG
jgi:hypothetical protein